MANISASAPKKPYQSISNFYSTGAHTFLQVSGKPILAKFANKFI